ncbi:MAG: RHS repeat-associated core domain-containing protein, partial [Cytophagales bacterium]|nr:RHS repeat-associated core domain-containing protein [Cytophagales bacterium]
MKNSYKLFLALFLLGTNSWALAQDTTYVKKYTAKEPFVNQDISDKNHTEIQTHTTYMDGFGRTVQEVLKRESAGGYDIVKPVFYDRMGRVVKNYMPYTSGTTGTLKDNVLSTQKAFYGNAGYTYSEAEFENSPLQRILKTGSVGDDWKMSGSNAGTYSYSLNDAATETVYNWGIAGIDADDSEPFIRDAFASNTLKVTTFTDEDGRQTKTYTNDKGQVLLSRRKGDNNEWLDTYNIYDKYGNLRFVLPPIFVDRYMVTEGIMPNIQVLETNTTLNQAETVTKTYLIAPGKTATLSPGFEFDGTGGEELVIKAKGGGETALDFLNLAYQYYYDHRNRLKKVVKPGLEEELILYDLWDRPVLTRDGNQRQANQWSFVKYDRYNRAIMTGVYTDSRSVTAIQADIDAAQRFETTSTSNHGYTLNKTWPTSATSSDVYTVSYYDNYDFVGASYFDTSALYDFATADYANSKTTRVLGLPTGGKEKILGSSTWMKSVVYYDEYQRVIQAKSENHLGGIDRASVLYKNQVTSLVDETLTTHYIDDGGVPGDELVTRREYSYDHSGRPLKTWQTMTNGTTTGDRILVGSKEYNERGQLKAHNIHATNVGETTFLQSVDLTYNLKGWLTKVNNGNFDASESEAEQDLFGMGLYYNESVSGYSNTARHNGSISAMTWKTDNEKEHLYGYDYNNLDQLASADYVAKTASTWTVDARAYDVENLTYDKNGNIKTLTRWTRDGAGLRKKIDELTYGSYEGNKLKQVQDAATASGGFTDGAGTADEFSYDGNGNLTADDNAGITSITYNHLDLPVQIDYGSGSKVEFTYSAGGAKLQKKITAGGTVSTIDYAGATQYVDRGDGQGMNLAFVQTAEGRVMLEGEIRNEYFLSDHLGNVRVVFTDPGSPDVYKATMESAYDAQEEAQFANLDATRYTGAVYNHTPPDGTVTSPDKSAMLNAALTNADGTRRMIGPATSLHVLPGDKVTMDVWARYESTCGTNETAVSTFLFAALTSAYGLSSSGETARAYQAFNSAVGATALIDQAPCDVPKAFLNYILFDSNFESPQFGFIQVSSSAESALEKLTLQKDIDEEGYLYIYVSNESSLNSNVYFDDLTITHEHSPLVQVNAYYPFGLRIEDLSYDRETIVANLYGFNGMEKNKELDLYSTAFRMYNPALARFNGMDPAASVLASYSPYHFSYNNPVNYSDPSGAFPGGNPMMGQIPPWVNEHGEDTRYMNENYGMDWNPFKTGRIGPGSGNHWADGIGRHDWTLHGGSESYRQELAYTKMYGGYELDGKLYTSDGHPINWSAGGITVKKFTGEVSDTFVGEDGNTYFYKYYRNVFVPFGSSQDEEGDIKKMGELSPNSAYVKRAYEVDGWTLFDEF